MAFPYYTGSEQSEEDISVEIRLSGGFEEALNNAATLSRVTDAITLNYSQRDTDEQFLKKAPTERQCDGDDELNKAVAECQSKDTPDYCQFSEELLKKSVAERRWSDVEFFFSTSSCHESVVKWALEECCKSGNGDFVVLPLLDKCNSVVQDLSRVLDICSDEGLWESVRFILDSECSVSEEVRQRAVERAVQGANQYVYILRGILRHCSNERLDAVCEEVVSRGLWQCLPVLLEGELSEGKRRWAVEEAVRRVEEGCDDLYFSYVVSYCYDDQRDFILKTLVGKNLWESTVVLLKKGVSDVMWRWTVEEMFERADQYSLRFVVWCGCPDDRVDFVIERAVQKEMWDLVAVVCNQEVSLSLWKSVLEEAGTKAEENDLMSYLNSKCNTVKRVECLKGELDQTLTKSVQRSLWKAVNKLLQLEAAIVEQKRMITEEANRHASDLLQVKTAVAEQRSMATEEASRHKSALHALEADVAERRRTAVKEASRRASDKELVEIVDHCDDDQVESILSEATSRGLWNSVIKLLERLTNAVNDASDTQRTAVLQACETESRLDFYRLLRVCRNDLLHWVLTKMVERDKWDVVCLLIGKLAEDDDRPGTHATIKSVVEEAVNRANDSNLAQLVQYCEGEHLKNLFEKAVQRGCWSSATHMLRRIEHSVTLSINRQALIDTVANSGGEFLASDKCDLDMDKLEDVLVEAARAGCWYIVRMARKRIESKYNSCVGDATWRNVIDKACEHATYHDVKIITRNISIHHIPFLIQGLLLRGKTDLAERNTNWVLKDVRRQEMLRFWARLFVGSLSTDGIASDSDGMQQKEALDLTVLFNDKLFVQIVERLQKVTRTALSRLADFVVERRIEDRNVFQHMFTWCTQRLGKAAFLTQVSLPLIANQNVNPVLRSLAQTSMCEETRRWYFQFLVEEELWDIVKELADHSLYDDQRGWALGKAMEDKRWDVMVVLGDHGLTDNQLMRVHRQVAKHADMATVQQLYDRSVDMERVYEELMAANPSRERPPTMDRIERLRNMGEDVTELEADYKVRLERVSKLEKDHKQRCTELETLHRHLSHCRLNFKEAVRQRKWYAVLNKIRHGATQDQVSFAMKLALETEAWHVVMQIVNFSLDEAQRDSLFSEVMRRRQWGVGRALLERGVSAELSRAALPQLMEENQWILVARVMELSLDDTERRRVMQAALDKKKGSVVAHGISVMEGRLSVEEREVMFDQALSQGVWQAVKRLVEEKDDTGIAHSNKALVVAVEQHRWDMVDHCDRHGADINQRDAEGDTLLHRETRRHDWDRVNGLLHHGANPNLPDKEGFSPFQIVLDKALHCKQGAWDIVKLCVQFHGNINQPDPKGKTPLLQLIKQASDEDYFFYKDTFTPEPAVIIDCALLWGGDVCQKESSYKGKTALHVVCQAGLWDSMRYVVGRGGDPLAVTSHGHTVLTYAVKYSTKDGNKTRKCRQMLVGECIKMGISTHQPPASYELTHSTMSSSLSKNDFVVTKMLYESGACTYRELHEHFEELSDSSYDSSESEDSEWDDYSFLRHEKCCLYLKKIATNPRSLQSSCRLVISHHLGVGKPRTRQARVKQLPLPDRMKDYVIFSDLVDQDSDSLEESFDFKLDWEDAYWSGESWHSQSLSSGSFKPKSSEDEYFSEEYDLHPYRVF